MSKSSSFLSVPRWFFAFIPYKIGEGLLVNMLPLFIVQIAGGSVFDLGKVSSLNALAGVVAFSLWGNLSDRMGRRRPFLILGMIGFCLCTLLIGMGHNVTQVLISGMVGGFLMAAVTPVSTALIIDSVPEKKLPQSFGRFYLIGGWSFVAALVLGVIWLAFFSQWWGTAWAMRSLFLFAAVAASLSLILCLLWIEEPKQISSRSCFKPSLLGRFSVAISERRALFYSSRSIYFIFRPEWLAHLQYLKSPLGLYYGCTALLFLGIQISFLPFPIFLTDVLKATNTEVFAILLFKSIVEALFYLPMGRFARSVNSIRLQTWATATRVGILVIFTFFAMAEPTPFSLFLIGIAHLLSGLTWAAINVSSMVSMAVLSPKGQEGMAMGVYNSVIGVSTIVGALFGGYLATHLGYDFCFGIGVVLMGLTTICLWSLEAITPRSEVRFQSPDTAGIDVLPPLS